MSDEPLRNAIAVFEASVRPWMEPKERAALFHDCLASYRVVCAGCGNPIGAEVGERIVHTIDTEVWHYDRETGAPLFKAIEEPGEQRIWHGPCAPDGDQFNHHWRKDDPRIVQHQASRN